MVIGQLILSGDGEGDDEGVVFHGVGAVGAEGIEAAEDGFGEVLGRDVGVAGGFEGERTHAGGEEHGAVVQGCFGGAVGVCDERLAGGELDFDVAGVVFLIGEDAEERGGGFEVAGGAIR